MKITIKLIFFPIITFAFCINLLNGQKINYTLNYNLYKKALLNESTAPNYILISVQSGDIDYEVICIEAPFLLGAIHKELSFDYSIDGENKAIDYALEKVNMKFLFQSDSAIQNIKPRYSQEILEEVINYFCAISTNELLNGPDSFELYLRKIWKDKEKDFSAYRDATAFVLLTRGILPTRDCFAGNLYVSSENKPLKYFDSSVFIGLKFGDLLKELGERKY